MKRAPDIFKPAKGERVKQVRDIIRPGVWLLLPVALAACHRGILDPAGPVADAERTILLDALAIMLAIVIPVIFAALAFAWWFRAGNPRARYLPEWAYSGRIELIVWSIPALVVLVLGGIGWIGSHALDPARMIESRQTPLEVDVVSLDWKWLFVYPENGVASINRLVVPAARPVHLRLTSASVMNVFFVPRIASEIYTMNGMVTQLYLQADRPGSYPGLSAHFSGDGFPTMVFNLDALTDERFAEWVASAKAGGPALDETAYRQLLKQSMAVPPSTYRSVSPHLFDAIVTQRLPPGEGPGIDPKGAK